MKKTKVVTYTSPGTIGRAINMSLEQIERLEGTGIWPIDPCCGQEYCNVLEGAHKGYPTFSDEEIEQLIKDHS